MTEAQVVRQPEGWCKEVAIYRQDNTLPAREFVFHDRLFPDRPVSRSSRGGEHEVADVQIGDIVLLAHQKTDGVPVCQNLMIVRRPGGRVPPAIDDDKWEASKRVYTRRNAEQFIEENAASVLLPRLLAHLRR